MAGHIRADAHLGARRRLQIEMRIETREALQLVEWKLETGGQRAEFVGRQVSVPVLNGPQLVENWRMMHGAWLSRLYVFCLEGVHQAKTLARAARGAL